MPRQARVAPARLPSTGSGPELAEGSSPKSGGLVYHVLDRAVARLPLFRKEADHAAFERVLLEAHERTPTRNLAWCIMRNQRG